MCVDGEPTSIEQQEGNRPDREDWIVPAGRGGELLVPAPVAPGTATAIGVEMADDRVLAAKKFLNWQFLTLMKGPEKRYIVIWCFPSKKTYFVDDVRAAAVRAIELSDAGQNVYFGLGLHDDIQQGGRGLAKDVIAINCVWADIDYEDPEAHKPKAGGKKLPPNEAAAMKLVDELDLYPSAIVHSGHGLQAYWFFKTPIVIKDQYERDKTSDLTRGWEAAIRHTAETHDWTVDSVADLSRVFRVPGTMNLKATPVPTKIIHPREGDKPDLYSIKEIKRFVIAPDMTSAAKRANKGCSQVEVVTPKENSDIIRRIKMLCEISPKLQKTWGRERSDLVDQSASGYDLALANALVAAGASDQEIADAILAWRTEHGEHPEKAMRSDYVMQTIGAAKRNAPKTPTAVEAEHVDGNRTFMFVPSGAVAESLRAHGPDGIVVVSVDDVLTTMQAADYSGMQAIVWPRSCDNGGEYRIARTLHIAGAHVRYVHPDNIAAISDALTRPPGCGSLNTEVDAMTRATLSDVLRSARPVSIPSDDPGLTRELAEAIRMSRSFAQDAGRQLHVFFDGVYVPDGEEEVRRLIQRILDAWEMSQRWGRNRNEEVIEYLRVGAPRLWEMPPTRTVNVLNGILDVTTRTLSPHMPSYLTSCQIPVRFDPSAKCPFWDRFVGQVFPADAVDIAFEIVAWLMTPMTSLQRAILLLGEGSNGKSTYLAGAGVFIGRRNISAMPLHRLEAERFAAAHLLGKLANICPDLPTSDLKGSSAFKAITGGDTMIAEFKFKPHFEFTPYARLVFSANSYPRGTDCSEGFYRRWRVVPFNRRFEGQNEIPRDQLDQMLASPEELSGVLNRALDVLPRLRRQGFTDARSIRRATEEFRRTTDPFAAWLDANTTSEPNAWLAKDELLQEYNQYREQHRMVPVTMRALSLALQRFRPQVRQRQRVIDGRRIRVFMGISRGGSR